MRCSMELISRPRKLTEKGFVERLQNGYILYAHYKMKKDGKDIERWYDLIRRSKTSYNLMIEEFNVADYDGFFEGKRDECHRFKTSAEALTFLKEKENFNISEWGYGKRSAMKRKFVDDTPK